MVVWIIFEKSSVELFEDITFLRCVFYNHAINKQLYNDVISRRWTSDYRRLNYLEKGSVKLFEVITLAPLRFLLSFY